MQAVRRAYPCVILIVLSTNKTARFNGMRVSAKTTGTHVELRLVWPVLAPDRDELFSPRELRVKQRLERVVEYMRHFARRGAQAVYDRHVVQECDYGHDDDLVLGDERVERADRVDMWGMQWECDFLIRLPELMGKGLR
jgi:hypothetical protein